PDGCALPARWARGHGVRHRRERAGRVLRDAVQQHPRHAAAGLLIRERAVVRDLLAGDVLASDDGPRLVLWLVYRYDYRGSLLWTHASAGSGARHQGRFSRGSAAHLPERDGIELLDRAVRVDRLLRRHAADFTVHQAHQDRRRAARPGLLAHAAYPGRLDAVVQAAGHAGGGHSGRLDLTQRDLLVIRT